MYPARFLLILRSRHGSSLAAGSSPDGRPASGGLRTPLLLPEWMTPKMSPNCLFATKMVQTQKVSSPGTQEVRRGILTPDPQPWGKQRLAMTWPTMNHTYVTCRRPWPKAAEGIIK